jgi:hypothetical protein
MSGRKEAGSLAGFSVFGAASQDLRAPEPTDAHEAPRSPEAALPARSRLRRSASRFAITASGALLLSLIVFPAVSPAAPVSASGCGTNWTSRTTPPKTIRVYLTEQNRVIVKIFRSYVPMVMASGEFPSRLPKAVLEAGATAVKQYAWYYALKGHHRDGYRTDSGVCYDVRNDTSDQLFKPAAHPTAKQRQAVADTWGLTLRKGKRFFLTGYRAGSSNRCGADRDGWRLYERSAANCAKLGWSRERIQAYYYAPRINFVWNGSRVPPNKVHDTAPPVVHVAAMTPARSQPGTGNVNVKVRWSATDMSGIGSYAVQEQVGIGAWQNVRLSSPRQTAVSVTTHPGKSYRFRVRARDTVGNQGEWITGSRFTPQLVQSGAAVLSGGWERSKDKSAIGGAVTSTKTDGGARLQFHGSSIGVVASRGPNFGRIRVLVDGHVVQTVDLWSRKEKDRHVVFLQSWRADGNHSITVQAIGSKNHPKVDLDAFVLLH